MFDNLTNLGWGVVTFAITIGVGAVVLTKFSGAIGCDTGLNGETLTYNATSETCYNSTGDNTGTISTGATNTNYLNTQLGTSGLAGWAPAIIAFAVGMLFLGAFLINKGSRRY